jgi:molybdate transport system ATP-binding protein
MIEIQIKKKLHGSSGEMQLGVDLKIQEKSFVALSGKSGSGKTTLLRILAGLEEAEAKIIVSDTTWQDENINLAVQKRDIGFVFQDYALFENMNVEQNLLFVAQDKILATKLLKMTELYALKDRYPNSLSGGQKQRVSICRAFMKRPKLLLLDEPLSALDTAMRHKLQEEILLLHKEFQTTTIMVSHDPSEIYKLASRVLILEEGSIKDDGEPKEVLLQTQGSQKFSFSGELLEIKKVDVIYVAVIAIAQQIVEIVVSHQEMQSLKVGDKVTLSTKAFTPSITPA